MRDAFKEKKLLTDPELIQKEYKFGKEQLQMLHRQVPIASIVILMSSLFFLFQTQLSQMFTQPKLVIERTH